MDLISILIVVLIVVLILGAVFPLIPPPYAKTVNVILLVLLLAWVLGPHVGFVRVR